MTATKEWKLENTIMSLLFVSSIYIAISVIKFFLTGDFILYLSSGELSIFHGAIFFILIDLTFIAIFFISFFTLAYLRLKVIMQDYIKSECKRNALSEIFLIFFTINLAFFVICIINVVSRM